MMVANGRCNGRARPLRGRAMLARIILAVGMLTMAHSGVVCAQATNAAAAGEQRIVVAIEEKSDPIPAIGSSPRGYSGFTGYAGSERSRATSTRIAREHGLTEISAWSIEPLKLRCMLYAIPAGGDREHVLAELRRDNRVHLAQPLQEFATLSVPSALDASPKAVAATTPYNDPYVGLQTGFSSIGAAQAQRWASGRHVAVALIDTGIDASHPDLAGRVGEQRDFVGGTAADAAQDRHGTEVAGVIAAVANNGVGIVGIAPAVELLSYRACWPVARGASPARCNSFTLAQALGAAIASKARIINLSLGGPHDPLLAELLDYAIAHGKIIVGAMPGDGNADGFPVGTKAVIAVGSSGDSKQQPERQSLAAPGEEILTLEPGGSYDYASGTSLATAHVTGAIALLLQISPKLDEHALLAVLGSSVRARGEPIDACLALRSIGHGEGSCEGTWQVSASGHLSQ